MEHLPQKVFSLNFSSPFCVRDFQLGYATLVRSTATDLKSYFEGVTDISSLNDIDLNSIALFNSLFPKDPNYFPGFDDSSLDVSDLAVRKVKKAVEDEVTAMEERIQSLFPVSEQDRHQPWDLVLKLDDPDARVRHFTWDSLEQKAQQTSTGVLTNVKWDDDVAFLVGKETSSVASSESVENRKKNHNSALETDKVSPPTESPYVASNRPPHSPNESAKNSAGGLKRPLSLEPEEKDAPLDVSELQGPSPQSSSKRSRIDLTNEEEKENEVPDSEKEVLMNHPEKGEENSERKSQGSNEQDPKINSEVDTVAEEEEKGDAVPEKEEEVGESQNDDDKNKQDPKTHNVIDVTEEEEKEEGDTEGQAALSSSANAPGSTRNSAAKEDETKESGGKSNGAGKVAIKKVKIEPGNDPAGNTGYSLYPLPMDKKKFVRRDEKEVEGRLKRRRVKEQRFESGRACPPVLPAEIYLNTEYAHLHPMRTDPPLATMKDFRVTIIPPDPDVVSKNSFIDQKMIDAAHQCEGTPVGPNEVLLSVAIFHPVSMAKIQEFRVLGSQSLRVLRDGIYCLNDRVFGGEERSAACFFIEGTFYTDFSVENSCDLAEPVLSWVYSSADRQEQFGALQSADMLKTSFSDLTIRIGKPYLYLHQGKCRHAVVFTQLRFLSALDPHIIEVYPLAVYHARIPVRKCDICQTHPARYVAHGDKQAPCTPCHFCLACLKALHYNADDSPKDDDYLLFPYVHDW